MSLQEEAKQREEKLTKALEMLKSRKELFMKSLGERSSVQATSPLDDEEIQQLRREVKTLEMIQGAKQRLDDRDEWRRAKGVWRSRYRYRCRYMMVSPNGVPREYSRP
jgi:hypothetical protein